jgi:hypothetical protein
MTYNGHFYWLMPRPVESDRSNASLDTDVVEVVVDDGSSDKSDSDDDDDGDDGREGVSDNITDNNNDAVVVSSSDEGSDNDDDDDDDDGQGDKGLSDYEKLRQLRIARNEQRLADLGLAKPSAPNATKKSKAKRKAPSTNTAPSRRSSRLAKSGGGNDASVVKKDALSDSFETDSGDDVGDGPFDDPLDEDEEDKDIENGFIMKKSEDSDECNDEENDEVSHCSCVDPLCFDIVLLLTSAAFLRCRQFSSMKFPEESKRSMLPSRKPPIPRRQRSSRCRGVVCETNATSSLI